MSGGKLENRVALITGASRGIGAAVAKLFVAEGAHVILLARSKAGLEETDDAIRSEFGDGYVTLMPFDITKIDDLEALGPTILHRFGKLDIFVANAGILGEQTPVSHSKIKDWKNIYTTNVLSNVQMIRTLEPLLKASDAGRAMVTGSGMGVNATAFNGQYGVSKAAVMFLFKTWAEETKKTNLRINMIRPGAVDTEILRQVFPGGYQGSDLRTPEQIAPMFLQLALPSCSRHGELVVPEDFSL
ncbi:MAG: SDR family oxidoreductase [Pseudobdellovibrionaceae bacterium]|jgi:NAD(P)-dependent dehydrogenase (short-subunit alcohol dehydrogenase family)|nr:SDR family oxidoreductase [Pseudobdellovibrionaceae bacterium]